MTYITTLPNPQFKANNRRICNKSGDLLYKTTTYFFRDDLHWDALVSLLSEKYRNTARVNVINHACSNGEEPYSLVVKLLHSLGDTAEKFFPIKAKDIDQDNINSAKAGRMGIILNDMYRINGYTKDNINTYFDYEKALNPMNDMVLSPKSNIKDNGFTTKYLSVIFTASSKCLNKNFSEIDSGIKKLIGLL